MQDNISLRNIPTELKMNALWCGWKLTEKGKEPFNLSTGYHAKSNDETTFSSYPVLLNNIHKYLGFEGGKQIGGVGLGIFRGYSAIDIDHCVQDGQLSEMAQDIVNYCKSYTEYSPSGTGIRIIFKTQTKIDKDTYYINNHSLGLEIYISDNTNKFVSITGNKISGDSIAEIDISYILNKYMKKGGFNLEKALKKDKKLEELWNSTAPGSHSNESELDMALACKLAFYCKNDEAETKKYFEMSPYFQSKDAAHKKKWESGYGLNTIKAGSSYIGPVQQYQPAKRYQLNDTGNAHRFIDMFGEEVRFNVDNNIWMVWNGKYWQSDVTGSIKNYVEILAEQMTFESASISDMNERIRSIKNIDHVYSSAGKESLLKEARHLPGIPVMNESLDVDKNLICCDNGTVDLSTGQFRENRKEDLISMTTGCPIETDPNKKPERFIQFINEMFVDPEVVHYVHKALGYSITNFTGEQKMFIIHGDGNNGKSLLLDVIANTLGSYAVTSKPQLLTEQTFETQNSEAVARLKGKRFCAVEEITAGDRMNEQLVKELTSGLGKMNARFLYANSFEFYVTCKIWLATNYEPTVKGVDKGVWRRIVKIPAPSDFTGKEDRELREKLLSEKPGILRWLVEGYGLYKKEGLKEPKAIAEATTEYRKEMDIVQQWVDETCEVKVSCFERANVLYASFRQFCMNRDIRTNQTVFGRSLGKKFKKYNSGEGIVYIGLKLKSSAGSIAKKVAYEQTEVSKDI